MSELFNKIKTVAVLVLLTLNFSLLYSQTTSGTLSTDEIWSGTVKLTGDVTVPEEFTLTIEPGTTVVFPAKKDDRAGGANTAKSELIINGSLLAKGTAAAKITFKSSGLIPARGDWAGIKVNSTHGIRTIELDHTVIEYAETGFSWIVNSGLLKAKISNTTIRYSSAHGIYYHVKGASKPELTVENSIIHDNSSYGLYFHAKDKNSLLGGTVRGSEIYGNVNDGLHSYNNSSGKSSLSIINNTIRNNSRHGIYTHPDTGTTYQSIYLIEGNRVHDNKKIGIHHYNYHTNSKVDIVGNELYKNSRGIYIRAYHSYTTHSLIRNNTVRDNLGNGIEVYADQLWPVVHTTISGNDVFNNKGHGVITHRHNSNAGSIHSKVTFNKIYNNQSYGLQCRSDSLANILYNDIKDNVNNSVYLQLPNNSNFNYNNITGNGGTYALTNGNGSRLNARYNFWTKAISDEMAAGANPKNITAINDIYDNAAKGGVDYSSWLTSAVVLPAAPVSRITGPLNNSTLKTGSLLISGIAAAREGVDRVEITVDNGVTWLAAAGSESWSYDWPVPADGTYTFRSRVTDSKGVVTVAAEKINVTIDSTLPTTSGVMSSDEHWSGELLITGDVTVPSGVTLTISAGTIVKFQALTDDKASGSDKSRAELIVKGSLIVEGTPLNRVLMSSSLTTPLKKDWYGIRVIHNESNEQLRLSHLDIRFSTVGIKMQSKGFSTDAVIDNTTIEGVASTGLYYHPHSSSSSTFKLTNSTLSSNSDRGVHIDVRSGAKLTVDVQNNKFGSNTVHGLHIDSRDANTITKGIIKGNESFLNSQHGIALVTKNSANTAVDIINNIVRDNKKYGIYTENSSNTNLKGLQTIDNNKVFNNSDRGVYVYSYHSESESIITNNELYNNKTGLHIKAYHSYTHSTVIRQNRIYNNKASGINVYADQLWPNVRAQITDNDIYGNKTYGIITHRHGSNPGKIYPTITLNRIYDNGDEGISAFSDGELNILYNDIRGNNKIATAIKRAIYASSNLKTNINYNNIVDNSGDFALVNGNAKSINAVGNFWSKAISDEINLGGNPKNIAALFDTYDNAGRGTIDYSGHLTQAVVQPAAMESMITGPLDGGKLKSTSVNIKGVAVAREGIDLVEISADSGVTWLPVTGKESWSYEWPVPGDGLYTFLSRVRDLKGVTTVSAQKVAITIDSTLPTTSGTLSKSETWKGEVLITGDISVPKGMTLTIAKGAVIKFQALNDDRAAGVDPSRIELIIKGSLKVEGTATERVRLTSSSANPAKSDWYGIRLVTNESDELLNMGYADVEHASYGVHAQAKTFRQSITLDNIKVNNMTNHGIYVHPNTKSVSTFTLTNSTISESAKKGLYLNNRGGAKLTIDIGNNRISASGEQGIYSFTQDGGCEIKGSINGNELFNNNNIGLYLYSHSSALHTVNISSNTVRDNKSYGIYTNTYNQTGANNIFTIEGNKVFNNKDIGIYSYVNYGRSHISILKNELYNNKDGIHLKSHNNSGREHQAVIRGNIVRDNLNTGVNIYADTHTSRTRVNITDNDIFGNGSHGLILHKTTGYQPGQIYPTITLNRITNNGDYGLYCKGDGEVKIFYNDIRNNQKNSFYFIGGHRSNINYNNIIDNKGTYTFQLDNSASVNARFNYWPKAVSDEMALGANPKNITAIYDIYDNNSMGLVNYSNWLTTAVALPPAMASNITAPIEGAKLKGGIVTIKGIAAAKSGVKQVEISHDNGTTWQVATGKESWSYDLTNPADGSYTVTSRVTDELGVVTTSTEKVNFTIDSKMLTTSGVMNSNETWKGEVILTGDVTVPSGIKLTIAKGTVVKFQALNDDRATGKDPSRTELIVKGSLLVEGTAAERVRFTSTAAVPAKGDWYGIYGQIEESSEQINISYADLEHPKMGLYMWAKKFSLNAMIDNINVSNSSEHGIYLNSHSKSNSTFSLSNSTITGSAKKGLYLNNRSGAKLNVDISNNKIDRSVEQGIYSFTQDGGCEIKGSIRGNELFNNTGIGLQLYSHSSSIHTVAISNNTIRDNKSYGIHTNTYNQTSLNNIFTIENNKIYNNKDIGIYTYVNYGRSHNNILNNEIYNNKHGIHVKSHNNNGREQKAVIRGNIVRDNLNTGVNIYADTHTSRTRVNITDNDILRNKTHGIVLHKTTGYIPGQIYPTITMNRIKDNGDHGIYCKADGAVDILYNDIMNNTKNAIFLLAGNGSNVNYNNILDNKGIYSLKNGNGSIINARFNHWDKATIDEINQGVNPKNIKAIFDIYDDKAKGTVDYSYWQNAPITQPTLLSSNIITPEHGSSFKTTSLKIKGIASAANGINRVEISPDNGINWYPATGKESWSYDWTVPADGSYTLMARVIDSLDNIESNYNKVSVTINSKLATTSGLLTADEVWSGEVLITGDVTVPAGINLTIEPGTVVRFAALQDDRAGGANSSRSELIVHGGFNAVGTKATPITFTSSSANPAKGDWYGIRIFTETKPETVRLENFVITGVHNAFVLKAKSQAINLSILNGAIDRAQGYGIYYLGTSVPNSNIVINNNSVRRSGNSGIFVQSDNKSSANVEIKGNILEQTNKHGIYAYYSNYSKGEVKILDNRVSYSNEGIYLNNHYSNVYAEISGNTVHTNTAQGIKIYTNHHATLYSQVVRNTVYNNNGSGIHISRNTTDSKNYPLIAMNRIYDNKGHGIYSNAWGRIKVHYNNIYNNSLMALHNDSGALIEARNNWWGAEVTNEMNVGKGFANIKKIYDLRDKSDKGKVDYHLWQTGLIDNTGDMQLRFLTPRNNSLHAEGALLVEGIAYVKGEIERIELSTDGGLLWKRAETDANYKGKVFWSYNINELLKGSYTIMARIVTKKGVVQAIPEELIVNIDKEAVTLSGTLESNQTWSGVIKLTGDVTVPAGVTLTIMPGTRIEVPALMDSTVGGINAIKTELIIEGKLLAAGTKVEPITFTTYSNGVAAKGEWVGIRGTGSMTFDYCTIENGETAISNSVESALVVKNSNISNNSKHGISYTVTGKTVPVTVTIENTTVKDNGGHGIYAASNSGTVSDLNLSGSSLTSSGDNGLYLHVKSGHVRAKISNNTVNKNKTRGIYLHTMSGAKSEITVDNNTIHHSGVGIYANYIVNGTSTLLINKNEIYSGTKGIIVTGDRPQSMTPEVRNNTIYNNSSDALQIYTNSGSPNILTPLIEGNQLYNNTGRGIYLKATGPVTAGNNSIYDNSRAALYNDSAHAVNARNNWWGITATNELSTAVTDSNITFIYDRFDEVAKGPVDYADWQNLFVIPALPTVEPIASPTNVKIQTLKGTKEAGSAIVINGTIAVPVDDLTTWSHSYTLSEGANRLKLYAENSSSMTSETVTRDIVLDTKAPILHSSTPETGSVVRRVVEKISINLQEEGTEIDTVESLKSALVKDSTGSPVAGRWETLFHQLNFIPAQPLADGNYTVNLQAVDKPLANKGAINITFTVDLMLPEIPVLNPVSTPVKVNKQLLKGTKEAGTSVWLGNKEIVAEDGKATWQYELLLSEGQNSHELYVRDRAGNRSPVVNFNIILDTKAPVLTNSIPVDKSFINGTLAGLTFDYLEATTALDSAKTLPNLSVKNSRGQSVAGKWTVEARHLSFTPVQTLWEEEYTVTLKVFDQAGNSSSNSISFTVDTTAPDAPVLNPVESPTRFSLQTLSGTKEVNSSIRINGKEVVAVNTATTWSYEIKLVEGVNNIEIDSLDRAGNRSLAVQAAVTYDDVAPLPVNSLKAEGRGSGSVVKLDWTGYDESRQGDLTGYRVYKSPGLITQLTDLTPIAELPAGLFKYDVTGLTKGIKLYFAVVAVDSRGNSLKSVTPVSAIPTDIEAPEEVTNIRVESFLDRVVINWTHSLNSAGDLAGYRIYFNNSSTPILPAKGTAAYEETALTKATSYPVRITAYDGEGNESGGVEFKAATLLDNPTGLTADPQDSYVNLNWTAAAKSELVKHYNIYLSNISFNDITNMTPFASVKGTAFKAAGLINGRNYYFAVTTVNLSGGEVKSVSTIGSAPIADSQGPVISVVNWDNSPLTAATVVERAGTVTVEAADPMGVGRVEFRLDNRLFHMDNSAADGFSAPLEAYLLTDGTHDLTVVAYDSIGNATGKKTVFNLKLAAPGVPQINSPADRHVTNETLLMVTGKADGGSDILLYRGGELLAEQAKTDSRGLFRISVPLDKGENIIELVAANRAGNSAKTLPLTVTYDNSRPDAPSGLNVDSLAQGRVQIGWSNGRVTDFKGFNIYRANKSFQTKAEAIKLNSTVLTANRYDDLPTADGVYFYRVTTLDNAGNESLLSNEISAFSDSTMPQATSIVYKSHGQFDPVSGRMGPGVVDLTLDVSEKLLFAPYLTVVAGGRTIPVELTHVEERRYRGRFRVLADSPTGTAGVLFSARDRAGNRGTEILKGGTIEIDTAGPELINIELTPGAPIKNSKTEPVQLRARFDLTEAVAPGTLPTIGYLLSATGRTERLISDLRKVAPGAGAAESWEGKFSLPADGGELALEQLSFTFDSSDDLQNRGVKISAANSFEIYQNSLPALEAPLGLKADSLPGGEIKLSWLAVEEAADYEIYRKAAGEATFSKVQRSFGALTAVDKPSVEGSYIYAVASVRGANGEESISAYSMTAEGLSDSTLPEGPGTLTAELVGNGIKLAWTGSTATEPITYRVYRESGKLITTTSGLSPLVENINSTMIVDPTPSATEGCYAVTAVDAVGNESSLSNSVYLNYRLLPVTNVKVRKVEDSAPVLSWSHSGSTIKGYNIYLDSKKGRIKLNPELVKTRTFIDNGQTIDERSYTIVAIDSNDYESLGRKVLFPQAKAELKSGQILKRGVMNRLLYTVENSSKGSYSRARLVVKVAGKNHSSEQFTLSANSSLEIPVVVGGYSTLKDLTAIETTLELITDSEEIVEIVRGGKIEAINGMLGLSVSNEEFVRGAAGRVTFTLENSSSEEIELLTATSNGNRPSNEIFINILDLDGNMLSTVPFIQSTGESIMTLSNGQTVARIKPNGRFTSSAVEIALPATAPDRVRVELEIKNIRYRTGQIDQVVMGGMKGSREVTLLETSYYGEITSITPADSYGKAPVVIKGRAIERATKTAMADVPLSLVVTVNGFERVFKQFTGADGTFSYEYKPTYGEAGVYKAAALHPDLKDRPVQGSFVIRAIDFDKKGVNLNIPKNYKQKISLEAQPNWGTDAKNLRFLYRAEDQPGGALHKGINIELGQTISSLKAREKGKLELTIWADSGAELQSEIVLKVAGDEQAGEHIWHTLKIRANFSEAKPRLSFSKSFIDSGVTYEKGTQESIVLSNKGVAPLENVRVRLVDGQGKAVPGWAFLTTPAKVGNLKVGEERRVDFNFAPPKTVAEGTYHFKLEAESDNAPKDSVDIYITVVTNAQGGTLFKLSNIYTATKDKNGKIIQGLEGAKIRLQNEKILSMEFNGISDKAGEALFDNIPAGRYRYKITAPKHEDKVGTIWIKPGVTAMEEVFMSYTLISVEWSVTETTVKDSYNILLTATYETDVPAAVVVAEPAAINIPDMEVGEVFYGEIKITNYGLIRAEDVRYAMPEDNQYYRYELLGRVPETIEAKSTVILPYRITTLKVPGALDQNSGGGGCTTISNCKTLWYIYKCSNGAVVEGIEKICWYRVVGKCSGGDGKGGGGDDYIDIGTGGDGKDSGGKYERRERPVEGVVCGPKIYCEVDDECCKARAREAVKSNVDLLTGEYSDDIVDMVVPISGKEIQVKRYFYNNRWHFPEDVQNLEPIYGIDPLVPDFINKGGVSFEKADETGRVFSAGASHNIFVESYGYRWADKNSGEWRKYDDKGRLTAYGDRNMREVKLLYSGGRMSGMADGSGKQMLWYDYYPTGELKSVRDVVGRSISYEYTGGLLTKAIDLAGSPTIYSYDGEGRLSGKTMIGGRTVTINYNKQNYLSRFTYEDGSYKDFDYNYDTVKQEYYSRVVYSTGKVIERWFDADGQKIRTDINGVMQEKLIKNGRQTIHVDIYGNETVQDFDEWDKLSKVTYPDGRSSSYRYAPDSLNVVEEIDREGVVKTFSYDSTGRKKKETTKYDASNIMVSDYVYDATGDLREIRVLGDSKTADSITKMGYYNDGKLKYKIDPEDGKTSYTYDSLGNVKSIKGADGYSWTYIYDQTTGLLDTVVNPDNQSYSYYYDLLGNVKEFRDVMDRRWKYSYDHNNRVTERTDPFGNVTKYSYDFEGRLTAKTYADGKVEHYHYNTDGNVVKEVNIDGKEDLAEYDNLGRVKGAVSSSGQRLDVIYNREGQIEKLVSSELTQIFSYDHLGRPVKTLSTDGVSTRVEKTEYTTHGKVSKKIDAAGNIVTLTYDSVGRIETMTDEKGGVHNYSYDLRNNMVEYKDQRGNITKFVYDRKNRVTKKIFHDDSVHEQIYDAMDRLYRVINIKGEVIEYLYDKLGRLDKQNYYISKTAAAAYKSVTFSYDGYNRMTGWNDGTYSQSYTYDDALSSLKVDFNFGPFTKSYHYSHDIRGMKNSFTGPDAIKYDYFYNGYGQLTNISLPGEGGIGYELLDKGRLGSMTLPGGLKQSYSYNGFSEISRIDLTDIGGKSILKEDYSRDLRGMISTIDTLEGSYNYGYDGVGQIKTASGPGLAAESYNYDAAGNRGPQSAPASWQYNKLNQLVAIGTTTFGYDKKGNLASRVESGSNGTNRNYHYDIENRLVKIDDGAGKIVAQYEYDPHGYRVKKVVGGKTTFYLHNGEGLLGEYDELGNEIKSYGYRPGSEYGSAPLFMRENGSYYYYINDYKGAPKAMVTKNGAVVWSAKYDSSGKAYIDAASTVENNLRGSSQYYDEESGFHYNRYRYYSPEMGRYISRDPMGEAGGTNIYLFTENNGVNRVDPLGLSWKEVNCYELELSLGATVALGVQLGIKGTIGGQICDCCNMKTGEFLANDRKQVKASVSVNVGLGIGVEVEFAIISVTLKLTFLELSGSRGLSIDKQCGKDSWEVTVTIFKVQVDGMKGELSAGLFGMDLKLAYSISYAVEAYATLTTSSLTVGVKGEGSYGLQLEAGGKTGGGNDAGGAAKLPWLPNGKFGQFGDSLKKTWSF